MSGAVAAAKGLTSYQGTRRCFGLFLCKPPCQKQWSSGNSWRDTWQRCLECSSKIYPRVQQPLRAKAEEKDEDDAHHEAGLCGMCKLLGYSCLRAKNAGHNFRCPQCHRSWTSRRAGPQTCRKCDSSVDKSVGDDEDDFEDDDNDDEEEEERESEVSESDDDLEIGHFWCECGREWTSRYYSYDEPRECRSCQELVYCEDDDEGDYF